MPEPSALDRLRDLLERAKANAPDVPSLMPQSRVPQDPKPIPKPWQDVDTDKEDAP